MIKHEHKPPFIKWIKIYIVRKYKITKWKLTYRIKYGEFPKHGMCPVNL